MKKKGLASLLTAVTLAAGMVTAVPVSAADGNGNTVTPVSYTHLIGIRQREEHFR